MQYEFPNRTVALCWQHAPETPDDGFQCGVCGSTWWHDGSVFVNGQPLHEYVAAARSVDGQQQAQAVKCTCEHSDDEHDELGCHGIPAAASWDINATCWCPAGQPLCPHALDDHVAHDGIVECGACGRKLADDPMHDALLALSDTLDPDEGPVILAWAVAPLAAALTKALAERGYSLITDEPS